MSFGITFALFGDANNFTIYLLIMGAGGFFMPIIAIAQTVLIQENVEAAMMDEPTFDLHPYQNIFSCIFIKRKSQNVRHEAFY